MRARDLDVFVGDPKEAGGGGGYSLEAPGASSAGLPGKGWRDVQVTMVKKKRAGCKKLTESISLGAAVAALLDPERTTDAQIGTNIEKAFAQSFWPVKPPAQPTGDAENL